MSQRLTAKRALVTGGASGIGQATAQLLAAEDAAVIIADLNLNAAVATAAAIEEQGGKADVQALDVTDEAAWERLFARLQAEGQSLDIVVNSAGVSAGGTIAEMDMAEWQRVLNINLNGVLLGIRFAIRAMQNQGRGSIINIASVAGIKALPGASAYCVSKAGVCMLSRIAALECAQQGWQIRVNAVLPGGVKTPIWQQMDVWNELVDKLGSEEAAYRTFAQETPLKRWADPLEIAQAVLYFASDESSYVTGAELVIDGGFAA